MKLQNKKTGEIGVVNYYDHCLQVVDPDNPLCANSILGDYRTLAELNEEWEDYKEPETYYYISDCANIESLTNDHGYNLPEEIWYKAIERKKEIGNHFITKEDAKKAVNKLKAWKRLKDNWFRFTELRAPNWNAKTDVITIKAEYNWNSNNIEDLRLLFGDEE